MKKIKIGLFGFGKTGRFVANEFLNNEEFELAWVVRKSLADNEKYASRLLGHEYDAGLIVPMDAFDEDFLDGHHVDVIVDFSSTKGVHNYVHAAKKGVRVISAVSKYEPEDKAALEELKNYTAVLYSPNITLGINFLLVASQVLQKIAPHADIEIVEEHFRDKQEASGTALKIADILGLEHKAHVNSIRVGGVVGRHEIIFGLPNQTIRLVHESISRAAFGQGAIFASRWMVDAGNGIYTMENIISDMFSKNIPVY